MSRLSHRNKALDENGVGECSCIMWGLKDQEGRTANYGEGYGDAGFCNEPAYGFQAKDYTGEASCNGLACPEHGGPDKYTPMDLEARIKSWVGQHYRYRDYPQSSGIHWNEGNILQLANIIIDEVKRIAQR
jgi:hypothetical protein